MIFQLGCDLPPPVSMEKKIRKRSFRAVPGQVCIS